MMFKVGDVVECLKDYDGQFTKGGEYKVRGVRPYYVEVERDDRGSPNGWMDRYFRLAEPRKSPVRAVMRREIVPGNYGMVKVGWTDGKDIFISVNEGEKQKPLNAEELREAAHILNQLAEVLEENK